MFLDDRKKKILQAIIEDFVSTGEPVGSRTVAKKYNLGSSAATIRNDMADLEEMGLLQQPHTSSGRIPSDLGYREYVDKILKCQGLSRQETYDIREKLENTFREMSQFIRQVSNLIPQVTNYTSVAITPQLTKSTVKHLQLVPIDKTKVLLVLVTNDGLVKNFVIKVSKEYGSNFLFTVSNILNEKFSGFPMGSINNGLREEIEKESFLEKEVLIPIFKTLREVIYSNESSDVFLNGTSNILKFPEFSDATKAKGFMDLLDEKEFIVNLLGSITDDKINITIGSENAFNEFKDCSLITTSYRIEGKLVGTIGVIGPTRMNYDKVISCIEYLRNELNHLFENLNDKL